MGWKNGIGMCVMRDGQEIDSDKLHRYGGCHVDEKLLYQLVS